MTIAVRVAAVLVTLWLLSSAAVGAALLVAYLRDDWQADLDDDVIDEVHWLSDEALDRLLDDEAGR